MSKSKQEQEYIVPPPSSDEESEQEYIVPTPALINTEDENKPLNESKSPISPLDTLDPWQNQEQDLNHHNEYNMESNNNPGTKPNTSVSTKTISCGPVKCNQCCIIL